ncbi:MAG: lasso peptide biosynthesis B2 protein [Chloroflexota bacterium]
MSKWWMDKAGLARSLSAADWLALTEAWWTLLGCWLVLHWTRFARFQAPVDGRRDPARLERLQRLVAWAARLHLLPMTCLVQACTLRGMAARRGLWAQVRIGAARSAGGIHAHAWVEVDGQPLGGTGETERFQPLVEHAPRL